MGYVVQDLVLQYPETIFYSRCYQPLWNPLHKPVKHTDCYTYAPPASTIKSTLVTIRMRHIFQQSNAPYYAHVFRTKKKGSDYYRTKTINHLDYLIDTVFSV
jgi:hypothetical protein